MRLRWLLTITCLVISLIPIAMIIGFAGIEIVTLFLCLILFITLAVAFVISYIISMPLVKLTKNIDEISKGNLDVELEKSEIYEINNLTNSLDRVMASLKLAINKVGVRKEEIFEDAIKAKEEAEAKYELLLKKIDGWIWEIDEKGICTKCSSKITGTLGYSPKQIIGKDIFRLLSTEDVNKFKNVFHVLSQQRTDTTSQLDLHWLYQNSSHPIWVRSFCIPVFDGSGTFKGLRCFSRDATEYQAAEKKIKELEDKLSDTYKQLHEVLQRHTKDNLLMKPTISAVQVPEFDYMILFDENEKIIDCTNDIQKILGFTKEELLTRSFADVAYIETYDKIKESLKEIKKQGSSHIKSIHKRKDGTSLFVSEHITYLKDRNLFICMVKQDTI
jgi:PAS domain S-box-containing protein